MSGKGTKLGDGGKGTKLGAPKLPTNIRLSWKGLPGTNALAYYENL